MRKRNILIAVLCCVLVFSAFPGKGEAAPQRECVQQYQSARIGFAIGSGEEGCNAYDMVFDAVAKFCAYYNSFSGGSFGNVENFCTLAQVRSISGEETISNSRGRLLKDMVFLPRERMEIRYPVLRRYPALLPVLWIVRGVKAVFFRRKKIVGLAEGVRAAGNSEVNARRQALQAIGLGFFEPEETENRHPQE